MKAIILNGPPRSGKDTLLTLIEEYINVEHPQIKFEPFSYKWVLCYGVADRYHLDSQWVWDLNADTNKKDLPQECFGGKSVRQCLIYESEEVIKKRLGPQGVAIQTFDNLRDELGGSIHSKNLVLCTPDGGFDEEVDCLCEKFGITRKDVFIVRIDREGHTFEGDSRGYLNNPSISIVNDKFPYDMLTKIQGELSKFLTT